MKVSGKFDVEMKPLEGYASGADGVTLGRMSIDKTFFGALDARSQGELLNARSAVAGSAGYVAIEQVRGSLGGKNGGFVLQHYGTMQGETSHLMLEVVPDSGSGGLAGLIGKMALRIENGQHFYDFEYELPAR